MRHNLGRVVASAAVAAAVPHELITALLDRHATGDWGDLDPDDKAAYDDASFKAAHFSWHQVHSPGATDGLGNPPNGRDS